MLASSFLIFPAQKTLALSIDDYFVYTYNFTFSKTAITGSETFYVTVTGQATYIKDMPLPVSKASVISEVVAQHRQTGAKVILNPNFSLLFSEFPNKDNPTVSKSVQVPLSFPAGSTGGGIMMSLDILQTLK
jgi:hypothetical protein